MPSETIERERRLPRETPELAPAREERSTCRDAGQPASPVNPRSATAPPHSLRLPEALPHIIPMPAGRLKHGLTLGAAIALAADALLRNKTRSMLSMLGIIMGVASVITMLGLGEGSRLQMEAHIRRLGSNLLNVWPEDPKTGAVHLGRDEGRSLNLADAAAVRKKCPAVELCSARCNGNGQVKHDHYNTKTRIAGSEPTVFEIRNLPIEKGRTFSNAEMQKRARVCLLGAETAEDLFPQQEAVGQTVMIMGQPFEVIGTLVMRGGQDAGWDDRVWVPVNTWMRRLFMRKPVDRVDGFDIRALDESHLEEAQSQVEELLRKRHKIRPGADDDFQVRNQADVLESANEQNRNLTTLLGGVAAISLLVGGIGIRNIMLASVTERTREIGIRRAVGARGWDVLLQFLSEAVMMCGVGAVVGIGGGYLACWAGQVWLGWPTSIAPTAV